MKTHDTADCLDKIEELETDIRHLRNELRLTKAEHDETSRKYFDIHFNLEQRVKKRTEELERINIQLQDEIRERHQVEQDKLRLESLLRQAQKMEAIGTLAGGIAHDFNNILVAILGFTELAMESLPDNQPVLEDLAQVLEAGKRARDLIQHILTFSRQSEVERRPLQVYLVIKEAIKLLRASIPKTIEIRQDIRSRSVIDGDPTQIHQVLINLCTNAAHAMEESGGILEVNLTDVQLSANDLINNPELSPGAYLELTVRDTGTGIDPLVIDKIFDPYFTTKGLERGSGMGLAVVHGIVSSHHGMITVKSEPGRGSAFHVYFPIISGTSEEAIPDTEKLPTGSEHVLLVDDEWSVNEISRKTLASLGYTVTARTSSIEALAAFRANPNRFDLVITDQSMPNMTGAELARHITAIRPEIPVILCTGYSPQVSREKAAASGICEFVMKPLIRRELAALVRQVIDRPTKPPSGKS